MNREATGIRRTAALIFRRSLYVAIPVATIVGLTAGAYGAIQKFTAGGKVSAAELNGNFTDLDGRVGSLESKVVVKRNGKLYSIGATYCGSTAKVLNGQITNGYAGLKSLCENLAACGPSASAHACSGEELSRTRQREKEVVAGLAVQTTDPASRRGTSYTKLRSRWNRRPW